MRFCIADTFSDALSKLQPQEQKTAKVTVFDLQQDPASLGLKFHRVDKSKDENFWSIRVNRDIRIIVHKTASSFLVCYVDHHDDAYTWAERRRIDTHPRTGAAQIVEVRERIEEITRTVYRDAVQTELDLPAFAEAPQPPVLPHLFAKLSSDDLLGAGVPEDWISDVLVSTEDTFFPIAEHIPAEAAEALLDYVSTGRLREPEILEAGDSPFNHPDAQRRFRIFDDVEELSLALDYPWDKWAIYLHPAQRQVVKQTFNGPARVSGSAGTGKTVVALHRAAQLLKNDNRARLLLTTFSGPLSNALEHKFGVLLGADKSLLDRATILPFKGIAKELFTLVTGHDPRPASRTHVQAAIETAVKEIGDGGFTMRFLLSEWSTVLDAWQIQTLADYASVPRLGRKNRMGTSQRERIWPIIERARHLLESQRLHTWPMIFDRVSKHFSNRDAMPFTHIVVDEAQDLGVPELRMLAAIAPPAPNALFFAGDLGQRIFQEPFSWMALGVDIRGRSRTLKVNYRTSHQIRMKVDKLLPDLIRDVDGNEDERTGTVSVFNGPDPDVRIFEDEPEEIDAVATWISSMLRDGVTAQEIGIFVRSENELNRARAAVKQAGAEPLHLSERVEDRTDRIAVGTMHLAKGLEFKAVAIMACDNEILPLESRIETAADEAELDQVFETERHLFYVACTRARDMLLITGLEPASEFLEDLDLK